MNKRIMSIGTFSDVQVEVRNGNSDRLVEEVITYMAETLNNTFFHDLTQEHDRDIVVQSLEYFFQILLENDFIEQVDVVFDKRNNKRSDMDDGKFHLETRFKQKNCLNTTSVLFKIGYPNEAF